MRLGPYDITITKRAPPNLSSVESRGGWWPIVRESFSGAWQENAEQSVETVLAFSAVFSCVRLICSDIAKMRLKLVEQDANQIWNEIRVPAFSPLLQDPNRYQNRLQFVYWWHASKLIHGNTYAIKQRDERQVVTALYVLDPTRVRPMVAPDGAIYYELKTDNISGIQNDLIVPASEIIHDVGLPMFHPLVGVSPIFAAGLSAVEGLRIQNNSSSFFANGSQPGGVLTAPGAISMETAQRMKTYWDENFTGANRGKIAIVGDGLSFQTLAQNAQNSQLIEQLEWTSMDVCRAFLVPAYKINVGEMPTYNNIEELDQQYWSQCLQFHMESFKLCVSKGIGLDVSKRMVSFELDDLLTMDTAIFIKFEKDAVGVKTINESRKRLNLKPMTGGDQVYLQHQDHSIEALAKRDEGPDPFANASSKAPQPATAPPVDDSAKVYAAVMTKAAEIARRNAA